MNKRFCKECKKEINGRIDRKFCTQECRSSYHNREYRANYVAILKINKILKKNYKILCKFHEKDNRPWPCSALFNLGFNFDYFTSIDNQAVPNQSLKMYCYDYSYIIIDHTTIIIKKDAGILLSEL